MYKVFSLMPENLPANASVMTNRWSHPARIEDATPGRLSDHVQHGKACGHRLSIRTPIYTCKQILRRVATVEPSSTSTSRRTEVPRLATT